jgi:UDP-glucose 4-epimerase
MATILVTGDTGFIGKALVRELLHEEHRVIGVSRSTSVDEDLQDNPEYTHISSEVFALTEKLIGERIDVLIDLAWAGSMGPERGDKEIQNKNLVNALHNVNLAHELDALLYLGVGTITELTALADDAPEGPATTYGLSKNLAHQETKKRAGELGVEHIWIRLGNTYSEDDTSGRFLNSTLGKLAANEEVELLTGNQPFDFIHITDAVRAIHLVSFAGENGEVYYVGNGDVATIEDFTSVAANVIGSTSPVKAHHVEKLGLTPEDLSNEPLKELGYSQSVSFIEGVKLWRDAFNARG